MPRIAAFFDLDRTLIDVNSGYLWARHERRHGNISRLQYVRASAWALLYHFDLANIDQVFTEAIGHYRGVPEFELNRRTLQWFHDEVEKHLCPKGRDAVLAHQRDGHPAILLTNSSCYEATAATETWKLDGWLANHFPVDERGCLIGTFERPLCYGAGKVARAEKWAQHNDVDLDGSYFYTDSMSDLPMLERVAEPRVVNPDPKLRRTARKRGWQILDWNLR